MTLPKERIKYSAIIDRPRIALPNGARLIVPTVINLEVWDISRPMPTPGGNALSPDVPNWTRPEYGMRVRFWRLYGLYKRLGIRPTISPNAKVCLDYPRVAHACKDAGWEFMAHGLEQWPMHHFADQQDAIRRSLETITEFTGECPIGGPGPGLTLTHGLSCKRWRQIHRRLGSRRRATKIETTNGPLVSLPFAVECNDIAMMAVQHYGAGIGQRNAWIPSISYMKKVPKDPNS